MKKLTHKQRIDRVFAMAEAFENQMDSHRMCLHEQVDATAILLSHLMRGLMEHIHVDHAGENAVETVDNLLSDFVATLSACTGPCAEDDVMRGVKINLSVTAADNEYVE
jgi:hypothetical protein